FWQSAIIPRICWRRNPSTTSRWHIHVREWTNNAIFISVWRTCGHSATWWRPVYHRRSPSYYPTSGQASQATSVAQRRQTLIIKSRPVCAIIYAVLLSFIPLSRTLKNLGKFVLDMFHLYRINIEFVIWWAQGLLSTRFR